MESGLCLYNSMKQNGLLPNMTPSEARQYYGKQLEEFIKHAYKTENIPYNEIMTGPNSMGTISILQLYLKEHPEYAFKIVYDGSKTFWLKGEGPCTKFCGFRHMGSHDSGHFEAYNIQNETASSQQSLYKDDSKRSSFMVTNYNYMGYENYKLVNV